MDIFSSHWKVHYCEADEMEGEFEEEEDLGEVSPSGDVERMIGGGCPAAGYKGRRRVSVDGGNQGITQLHLQLERNGVHDKWTRI